MRRFLAALLLLVAAPVGAQFFWLQFLPPVANQAALPACTDGSVEENRSRVTKAPAPGSIYHCPDGGGSWSCIAGTDCPTSGGVSTFLALTDTPDAYTGQGSKLVRVNAGATALEFTAPVVDTDTTCNDVGVVCLFAGSATEGGAAASGDSATAFFPAGTLEAALLPAATETAQGAVELATSAETTAGLAVQASDTRLSDSRVPSSHVLADTTGLGPAHSTSGLTAGLVLRASAATAAAFAAIQDGDLPPSIARDSELSNYLALAGGTLTGSLLLDNQQELRLGEPDAAGAEYIAFVAPATVAANRLCTLVDGAAMIPDSCVGDGTDAGGSGDVVGPILATDNYFARWDGTTGKLLQDNAFVLARDSGASTGQLEVKAAGNADLMLHDSSAAANIKKWVVRSDGDGGVTARFQIGLLNDAESAWIQQNMFQLTHGSDPNVIITQPLRTSSGTASLPGVSFSADPNSGFRRAAEDDVRGACGGSDCVGFKRVSSVNYATHFGLSVESAQAVTCTSSGDANPGALTITPTASTVEITNADPDGCNITMAETGMEAGVRVDLIVVSNAGGTVNFADSAGVLELKGAMAAGINDALYLKYTTAAFNEIGRTVVGDFIGPASSTDNAIVRFDGTTGKLGQDSRILILDQADAADVEVAQIQGPDRGTVANNDKARFSLRLENAAASQFEYGRISWKRLGDTSGQVSIAAYYNGGIEGTNNPRLEIGTDSNATIRAYLGSSSSYQFVVDNNGGTLFQVVGTIVGTGTGIPFRIGASTSSTAPALQRTADGDTGMFFPTSGGTGLGDEGVLALDCLSTGCSFVKKEIQTVQTVSIADDGAGTKPSSTFTPTTSYIECSCLDTNPGGCTVALSETGAQQGQELTVVVTSAQPCEFADTAGVTELAGAFTAGTDDTLQLIYGSDRFRETGRSDN